MKLVISIYEYKRLEKFAKKNRISITEAILKLFPNGCLEPTKKKTA